MERNFKFSLIVLTIFTIFNVNAQKHITYKDVLYNGEPARLNLATGEFILIGSNGKDSIINTKMADEDTSIERLNFHIVESGEDLESVSKQYGLNVNELKSANYLKSNMLRVGQKLRVRNFDKIEETHSDSIWIVQKGHSLYHISRITGVSITTLKRLNGLKNNNLAIGQKLFLK